MGEGARQDWRVRLNERAPHPAKEYTALQCVAIGATGFIVSLGTLFVCAAIAAGVI